MSKLLLETGDALLLETGDALLLEGAAPTPTPLTKLWYGPLWPLPPIEVGTPGTGIPVTDGIEAADLESTEYNEAVAKGVMISCPSTNTSTVYLVMRQNGTYSKDTVGTVILSIEPGQVRTFPQGGYGGNRYEFTMFGIDGESAGDLAYPCMIMQ